MRARGKVLREPNSGPGLLMIDGQQFRFALDGTWRSDTVPKRGLDVVVELDHNLQVTAITAVPEPPIVAEHAETGSKSNLPQGAQKDVVEFGAAPFLGAALLVFGWFFLTTLSIAVPFAGKVNLTFWQLLGVVNASDALDAIDRGGSPSPGLYSLAAAVALTGPFLHHFWKDKRAYLGSVAPLLFMLVIWGVARNSLAAALVSDPQVHGVSELAKKWISYDFGLYFSGLTGAYFAAVGGKRYLQSRKAEAKLGLDTGKAA